MFMILLSWSLPYLLIHTFLPPPSLPPFLPSSLPPLPGPLGTIIRSSKRLYLRLYYTLMDDKQCYFTFKTVKFTSMEEDRGEGETLHWS